MPSTYYGDYDYDSEGFDYYYDYGGGGGGGGGGNVGGGADDKGRDPPEPIKCNEAVPDISVKESLPPSQKFVVAQLRKCRFNTGNEMVSYETEFKMVPVDDVETFESDGQSRRRREAASQLNGIPFILDSIGRLRFVGPEPLDAESIPSYKFDVIANITDAAYDQSSGSVVSPYTLSITIDGILQ